MDGDAVTAWLRAEHDALLTALDRVRGRAEIAVTWRPDAPDVEAEAGDGAAYLRALAAGWHRAHSAGDRVRAAGALPGVVAVRVLVETPAVVKGSVLTRREDAGQVRQVLADEDFPGRWRASGPYAPYSFADGDWS